MTIRVRVAGLGDVGPITVWGQTQLESTAQGTPSEGTIAIRDLGFSPIDFVAGSRVEVDLGPDTRNIWGGYLMRSSRSAWFPVDDPDKKHRLWILHLLDNNVLFSKRVVAKLTDPGHVEGPIYKTTAYDDDVIATLVSEWLDLSTDGIDTSSLVNRVASIYYGQPTYPWNAGFTWQEAMDVISQLPAAVYALDPDWNLIYGDVDDANVDFILHNNPRGGSGRHGYRESTIWNDGSRLANDFLAWGFGKGSAQGVFSRETNDASIEAHGLWQDAFTAYDIWHQSTINKVTDSAVNGSPTSHRGRKDDRVAVEVATMEHGLRVADRVRYVNTIYDFDDVLPVRKITIKPVTADVARYELVLSHEIDRWGFQDPSPPWSIPTYPIPDIPADGGGDIGGGTPCECGITDTFDRVVALTTHTSSGTETGEFTGTSDAGIVWDNTLAAGGVSVEVDGSSLVVTSFPVGSGFSGVGAGSFQGTLATVVAVDPAVQRSVRFSLDTLPQPVGTAVNYDYVLFKAGLLGNGSSPFVCTVQIGHDDNFPSGDTSFIGDGSGTHTSIPNSYWVAGQEYTITATSDGATDARWTISSVGGSYSVTLSAQAAITNPFLTIQRIWAVPTITGDVSQLVAIEYTVDDLDIPEISRCSAVQFDNFNRSAAGPDWGAATPSGAYWASGGAGSVSMAVQPNNPSNPNWPQSVGGGFETHAVNAIGYQIAPLPFAADAEFTCTFEFLFDQIFGAPIMVEWIVAFGDGSGANTGVVMMIQHDAFGADSTVQVTTPDGSSSQETFTFVGGTAYMGEFKVAADTAEFRVWAVGDAKPDDPIASVGMGGNPLNGTDMLVLATQPPTPGNFNVTWNSWMHNLDFSSYEGRPCGPAGCNDCVSTTVDDFERTDGGGWGTATNGDSWENTGGGGSAYTVEGGKGKIVFDDTQNDEETLASFVPTLPLDMTFLGVKITSSIGGIEHNRVAFEFTDFASGLEVDLTRPGNVEVLVGSFAESFDLGIDIATTDGVNMRVVSSDGKSDVQIYAWLVGNPEPDTPQITGAGIDGTRDLTTLKVFTTANSFHSQTVTVTIGGIAANDCSGAGFDDFDRDVDPGWGAASSGAPWSSVGGGNAIVAVVSGAGGTFANNLSASTSHTMEAPYGIPAGDFTVTVRCWVSDDDKVIGLAFALGGVGFGWHHNTGGAHPYVFIANDGQEQVNFNDTFWASLIGDYALMELKVVAGIASLTVWDEGTDKPPPQVSKTAIDRSGDSGQIEVSFLCLSQASTGGTESAFVRSISAQSCVTPAPGTDDGGAIGAPGATVGQIEFLAKRINETTYSVPVKYVPGSTQVFIDGVRQRPSDATTTREYTEYPDDGRVVFVSSIDPSDTVKIIVLGNGVGSPTPALDLGPFPDVTVIFTGSTISALNSFLNGLDDGEVDAPVVVGLPINGDITGGSSAQLHQEGRNNLYVDMRGCRVRRTSMGTDPVWLWDGGGSNVRIRNGSVESAKAEGTYLVDDEQFEHGVSIGGMVGFSLEGVNRRNLGGDGFHIDGGADQWSDQIRDTGGVFHNCGRCGVAITDGGSNVRIDHAHFEEIGLHTVDAEPNGHVVGGIDAGTNGLEVDNITTGSHPYGLHSDPFPGGVSGFVIVGTGASGGGPVQHINVHDVTMSEGQFLAGAFGVDAVDWTFHNITGADEFTPGTNGQDQAFSMDDVDGLTITYVTQRCTPDSSFVSHSGATVIDITTGNAV